MNFYFGLFSVPAPPFCFAGGGVFSWSLWTANFFNGPVKTFSFRERMRMMDRVRQEILFTGRVQGVGFRYTAKRVAANHPVTGWVKNLTDGSVQIVVEGSPREIDQFIENVITSVNATGAGRVQSQERNPSRAATHDFESFFIR